MVFAIDLKRFQRNKNTFWSLRMVFAIDFDRFRMDENTFEAFAYYLLSILSVFGWTKTHLKPSDSICYRFWAFSDERKLFWSLRILFVIDLKRFRMNKTRLKASDGICYRFKKVIGWTKHIWSLWMVFAVDLKRFWMNENTFEPFAYYLLLI